MRALGELGGRLARGKCQLRLEIESKLKAWLLQRCGVPLSTLSYEELRLVAEGKIREALRLHAHEIDILMPRTAPSPISHVSALFRQRRPFCDPHKLDRDNDGVAYKST